MAEIKYTSIINSFVSQEGSMGTYTNYVYYSVLVVYSSGRAEIVEGKANEIAPLLSFLRTPIDELQDIKQLITNLPSDISNISQKIEENMSYVVNSLYPIPDVKGMSKEDAVKRLEECGLVPNIVQSDEVPDNKQVVCNLHRNKSNFRYVDIETTLSVPAVDGLTKDVAVEVLEKAGFQVDINYVPSLEHEQGIVLGCSRNDNSTHVVELNIGSLNPELDSGAAEETSDTKRLLDGLRYVSNLAMESVIRRRLRSLYSETDSALVKRILDLPNNELRSACLEAIEILEGKESR